jgi:Threonyl-tRNA synthetase
LQDCIGRTWQCGTLQLDFSMPERFELEFVGADGAKHRPIMLHRTILGSLERFIGILLENTAGRLPLWLAPVQIEILPVSDSQQNYAEKLCEKLRKNSVRAQICDAQNSLGKRIRDAEIRRVGLILILGEKEPRKIW